MSVITPEHEALQRSARGWLARHCAPGVPRSFHEEAGVEVPAFLPEAKGLGWLGLQVSDEYGGEGYGCEELAIVLAETGRALMPGSLLPSILFAALVQDGGSAEQRSLILPSLVRGERVGTVAVQAGTVSAHLEDEELILSGVLGPVLAGALADMLLVPAVCPGGETIWCVVEAVDAVIQPVASVDPTRPMANVTLDRVGVPVDRQLPKITADGALEWFALLLAAESVGVAEWCLNTASEYAKVREQFGRPIGQFQAVKHKCADMLLDIEQLRAAVWDAMRAMDGGEERALSTSIAAALASDTALRCATQAIQILGGIGFTWEHDAHLYLKRALVCRQLIGSPQEWRIKAARAAAGGARRILKVELDDSTKQLRVEVRAVAAEVATLDGFGQRRRLVDEGLFVPHWPRPYGRGADPTEQLVIAQELDNAGVLPHKMSLGVGGWVLPTLINHGSPTQQDRWILPTMYGELNWCQLFSEPGAGSDLAALSTRANKVLGGWCVTGQKVWTSLAKEAHWGICLARTNATAGKHESISCFMLDMSSPGIEIRPLRELTGHALFSEVFLQEVFIPDDNLIGAVDDGWRVARTTLANERVSMGSGSSFGHGIEHLLQKLDSSRAEYEWESVGRLLVESHVLSVLGHRATLQALRGRESGVGASLSKLLGAEHAQRVQEVGLAMFGAQGTVAEDEALAWQSGFLSNRCLTIAGGTSEIQRNLIAERSLGLPRD